MTVGLILALSFAFISTALATYPPYINLTTAGAVQADAAGAVFIQGGTGAGTGTFDPFLTLSPGGSTDTEKGYNTTAASGQFDTFFGGGRTHPIQAAAIPPITYTLPGGQPIVYREFSLDANDQGADDWMSLDAIKIYLDDQSDLTGYNKATDSFTSDNSTKATKIYDMGDGVHVLMRSQTLTPGSGVSDITVLIPESLFPANCFYGSTSCDKWVYFYNEAGFLGNATADGITQNWNVTSGFEEWRTRLLPVVNVTKTAVPSATRTFDWTLTKEISVDGGNTWQDAASVDLFNGQSQQYLWKLTWTKSAGVMSNQQVSGTITVTNPTGGTVIATPIDAVINGVSDVLTLGAITSHPSVNCGVTFPYTLKAQQTLSCTYTATGVNTDNGTNIATVAVDNGTAPDVSYSSAPVAINWANATITDVDASASINDPNFPGANQSNLTSSGSFTSTAQTFTCGNSSTITNTATLTEGTSGQTRTDSASFTATCWGLSVSKTANTSFTRTYDWTLQKDISIDGGNTWQDAASVSLFIGQSQDYKWKLTWTKNAGTDSDWLVQGTITVTNPAPIAATGVAVSDALSISGAASVSCPSTTIAANGSMQCTYSKALAAATNQTNTATAALAGHNYTGNAAVTFSSTPTTEVDASSSIDDPNFPGADQSNLTTSGSFTSTTQTFTCGQTTTLTNTGTLTEGTSGQTRTESASLTANCYELAVAKTAATSFTRTYDWTLTKEISIDGGATWQSADSVDLFVGQTQDYLWKLTWTKNAGTDSNWAVAGSITVTNPAPIAATAVSVSDALSISGAAPVSCPSTSIAANSSMTCTYSAALSGAIDQTNTATATLAGHSTTGSAAVTFSSTPTTQVDASASINDPSFPGANQSNLTTSGSFTSTTQQQSCGSTTTITNTGTLTEGDSGQTRTSSATLTVNCYELGVTKTANTSFTRTYDWTLQKDISIDGGSTWQDAATVNLFNGQSQSYLWKLTWTKNAGTDSDWLVQGTITVTNPAPIAATGVAVTDALSTSGGASVSCPSTTIAANGSMTCTYSKALTGAIDQTNAATATLAGHSTTGTAAVTFSSTPTTEVDATAGINDPNFADAEQSSLTTSGSFTSTAQTYSCGSSSTIRNTATLVELDSLQSHSDSASLTVNCYGLTVTKTANTSLTRTYNWSIQKTSGDPTSLTLNAGETYVYPYTVTVNMTGSVDSAWAVTGTITVTNPAPIAATGVAVTDAMSLSGAISVSCPSTTIAASGSMTCTYSTSVSSGASQTNTATATLAGQGYNGSANVNFSTATVNQVDECINVTDSVVGNLGTACVGQTLPKTFSYNVTLGGYASTDCGQHTINNTATFTTNDTGTTGSASWTVTITVPCPTGCTLTQGYWKTHSKYGPAPLDPTWAHLGTPDFHEDTLFYNSGQTYYQVMWTAPKGGNAYYILAHQYIAALLNIRAGAATTPAVDAALAYANTFFNTYTPLSNLSKTERANAIAAAGTLGSYNTGAIGPGHCSEDGVSRSADLNNP